MAIISKYPFDNTINDSDAWIGTDSVNGQTKQYTAKSVGEYINSSDIISINSQMKYRFVETPLVEIGTIAFPSGEGSGTNFSDITELSISNSDIAGKVVVGFIEYLVDDEIIIADQSNIQSFGHYAVTSYTVDPLDNNFYIIGLSFIGGSGTISANSLYNIANFSLSSGRISIKGSLDADNVDSINVESTINGLVDSSTRYKSNDFSTNVAGTNTLNRVYNFDSKLAFGGTTTLTSNAAASTNTIITNTDEAISLVDAFVNYNLLYMQEGGGTTNISNIASATANRVYFDDPNATLNALFGHHINLDYYKGTVTNAVGIEINIQAPSFTTTETTIGEFSYIKIADPEAFTQGVTGDSWVINSLSPLPSRFYGNIGVVVDKAITLSDVSLIKQISTAFGDFSIADSIKYVSESGSHFFMDDNGELSNIHADKVITREIKLSTLNLAPPSSTATGVLGEIRYTSDYIYVCTATDTWKRTALTTW